MTKTLDTATITNELAQTAFFRKSTPTVQQIMPAPPPPEEAKGQEANERTPKQQVPVVPVPEPVPGGVRVGVPPPVPLIPKVKRHIRQRQPFDVYQDQYERLKKIAAEEKDFVNGRGMSHMVREAIDNYLRDHATPKGE
jgi:hypothetical protein